MLPRSSRVSREAFPLIMQRGRSRQSPFLSLKFLPRSSLSQFAVVVSKKVFTKATQRNLWKRRVRAVLIKIQPQIKNPHYFLFFLKKPIATLTTKRLTEEIKNILYDI